MIATSEAFLSSPASAAASAIFCESLPPRTAARASSRFSETLAEAVRRAVLILCFNFPDLPCDSALRTPPSSASRCGRTGASHAVRTAACCRERVTLRSSARLPFADDHPLLGGQALEPHGPIGV